MWLSQNCNSKCLPYTNDIDWNSTWLYLNNNSKCSNLSTSLKLNTIRSFRIKLILNEPLLCHISIPTTPHL
jgi:hypothetical protein